MPIGADIARFEKGHREAIAAAEALYDLAEQEGRVLEGDDKKSYETHLGEAEHYAARIETARALEKALQRQARPVDGGSNPTTLPAPALIRPPPLAKPEKGIGFTRYAMAMGAAKGNILVAAEIAKQWRGSTPEVEQIIRAAVAPATTGTPAWAGALVPLAQTLGGELIELLMPATIVGQLTGLRRVPFNVRIPRVTGGATANWVGEGKAKPVSAAAFDTVTLAWNKLAVIAVMTEELVRFSAPEAEGTVRGLLVDSIKLKIDQTFISASAAVAGVSPAGILNGVTATVSSGVTNAAILADFAKIANLFISANIDPREVVAIMNPGQLVYLASLRGVNDAPYFPTLTTEGGTIFGMRVITTTQIPVTGTTQKVASIVFIHQASVLLAQDPAMRVDVSREASVEMSTDPETDTGTVVSLWQQNMIGLLVEQFITWTRARDVGVQVLTGVPSAPAGA